MRRRPTPFPVLPAGITPPVGATLPAGVILAGGQARRLGGVDKAGLLLAGLPLMAWSRARLQPQVFALAVSSGARPPPPDAALPFLPDHLPGALGPLAGIHAGLVWAKHAGAQVLLSIPVDTPFFPNDLGARLAAARTQADMIAVAACAGRRHPAIALWPVLLAEALADALKQGLRKIDHFTALFPHTIVDFPETAQGDPFFNINRAEDLAQAEQILKHAPLPPPAFADNHGASALNDGAGTLNEEC